MCLGIGRLCCALVDSFGVADSIADRNSFEDGVPFTELPPEPVLMDPPLVIPKDLRPLGTRRRYIRTIQLIPDDDDDLSSRSTPEAEAIPEQHEKQANDTSLHATRKSHGADRRSTCRHHEHTGPTQQRKKLVRIASHVDVRGDKTTREKELLASLTEEAPDVDQQHASALDSFRSRNNKSTPQLVRA